MTGRIWGVVGATGTGKSALSLDLADELIAQGRRVDIVNADAMQFYRGMDIGTAKLPIADRRGVRHHLFDVLDPSEEATVAWFQPAARTLITELLAAGGDVILVGGSGLYVSSVLFDFQFPPHDDAIRAKLEAEHEQTGIAPLLERLITLAPDVAANIDHKNPRRVVRALELAMLGETAHATLPAAPTLWHPETRIIGVHAERSVLVERLDRRVDQMWREGMLTEIENLIPLGLENGKTASRAIGYAQALAQFRGEYSEAEAIAETQMLTRRYARRQVSWFKRYPQLEWINGPELSQISGFAHL